MTKIHAIFYTSCFWIILGLGIHINMTEKITINQTVSKSGNLTVEDAYNEYYHINKRK